MADSNIEWTDKTWNPVTGCSKVSPGCAHCYAETVANRLWGKQYGFIEVGDRKMPRTRVFTDVMTHAERIEQPLRWKKPARVFVNSMSDLFHEDVPDEFIDQVFAVMALAPQHTFQVLTKRAERMRDYLGNPYRQQDVGRQVWNRVGEEAARKVVVAGSWWPLPNVWLGVSVENQHFADERIPLLLQTPAAVRFISAEPLIGQVDLTCVIDRTYPKPASRNALVRPHYSSLSILDWVIVGGESGPVARPFDVGWARSIVEECRDARVPVFVKQLGARPVITEEDWRQSPTANLRDAEVPGGNDQPCNKWGSVVLPLSNRKGGDPAEWPEDLRVRQFPEPKGQTV